jgi:hypothetical protein
MKGRVGKILFGTVVGSGLVIGVLMARQIVSAGVEMAPVTLNMEGKDRSLVAIGSKLVNKPGSCVECHNWPEYVPAVDGFAVKPPRVNPKHYMAGGRPIGDVVSRNLTPDAAGRPAGYTFDEFLLTLRTGKRRGTGEQLHNVPMDLFAALSDRDVRAVYEYLRAIPHAEPPGAAAQ